MKIYIAAPLFNESERAFNEKLDSVVRECGHETFLPQREGGCVADLPEIIEGMPKRKYLFQLDCKHLDWCDAVLALLDGRVPDEGTCFELGYCYAKGKRCIGYKTDARSFIDGYDNLMLHGSLEAILRSETELREYLHKLNEEGTEQAEETKEEEIETIQVVENQQENDPGMAERAEELLKAEIEKKVNEKEQIAIDKSEDISEDVVEPVIQRETAAASIKANTYKPTIYDILRQCMS